MVEGALVVVVVVGVHCAFGASGCRDVDEARILVRQLHITMACPMHSYKWSLESNLSKAWVWGMAMRVGSSSLPRTSP